MSSETEREAAGCGYPYCGGSAPECRTCMDPDRKAAAPKIQHVVDDSVQTNAYARTLAIAIHAKHYSGVTQWRTLPDTLGLLTQIDNMTSGLTRPAEPLRTVTGDGAGELPKPIHVWSAIHDWHASHEWNGRMEAEAQVERALRDYARAAIAQALKGRDEKDTRTCTCHPDDDPPKPCAKRYAPDDCRAAEPSPSPLTDEQINEIAKDVWRQVDGGRPYPGWNVVFARAVLAASQP